MRARRTAAASAPTDARDATVLAEELRGHRPEEGFA